MVETFSGYVTEEFFGLNGFIKDWRLQDFALGLEGPTCTTFWTFDIQDKDEAITCHVRRFCVCACKQLMATSAATSGNAPTGLLSEYRKDVPPGWAPGSPDYPLRLYLDRVRVWYRKYDGPDETVGPLLAGRLVGGAQRIALSLRLPDPTGNRDVGDAALVRLSVEEVRDPLNPNIILQHPIVSGVQALFKP